MQYCKFIYCLSTLLTNYSLVVDFVTYRHLEKPLENLIIFQSRKFPSEGIELELAKRLQIPQLLVRSEISGELQEFSRNQAMALAFVTTLSKPRKLAQVSQSFHRLPQTPLIFVCKSVPTSLEIWRFFDYYRQQNILNVLLLYRANEGMKAHTMAPYPELQLVDLDTKNLSSFMQPKSRNVWGYKFLVGFFDDPPVVGRHELGNRTELCGLIAHVLRVFLKRVNGTTTLFEFPLNKTMREKVDIMANFFFPATLLGTTEASYPLFQTQICLMLPVESNIPRCWYLWYAFDYCTWAMLGWAILPIASIVIFIHKTNCRRADIGLYVLLVFRLVITQPVSLERIRTAKKKSIYLLYFSALFMVLTNIYEGSLTSLLSTNVLMPAVRTSKDFLKTDLKIMLMTFETRIYFEVGLLPRSLMPRLYAVDYYATTEHISRGNISYAYIMSRAKWLWYEKQQKHLVHPVFRIATGRLCTPTMLQVLALRKHSPFKGTLKILFLELQQFGMVDHWLSEVPSVAELNLGNETDSTRVLPLSLEHFTWGFLILGVSWSLALLVFLGELVVWKRREISTKRAFSWLQAVVRRERVNVGEVKKLRARKPRAERFRE